MQSLDFLPKFLLNIATDIHKQGGKAHLVGGWVRDHILGVDSKDYDVEVYGVEEETLLEILNQYGKASSVGKSFGVYIMRHLGIQYDFAFPRTELKTGDGHRGFEVQSDPWLDFETASKRRDFTINAMGFNLITGEIIDPQGGQKDLADGILRHVGDAFGEDPLRALRAIQFAGRFDLKVPPETVQICAEQDLSELSTERFEEEFKKLLLKAHKISKGLWLIREMNLLRFFPELDSLIPTQDLNQNQDPIFPLGFQLNTASHCLSYFAEERDQLIFMYTLLGLDLDDKAMQSFMSRFTNDIKLIKGVSARRKAWKCYQIYQEAKSHEAATTEIIPPGIIRRIALDCPIQEFALLLELKLLNPQEDVSTTLVESANDALINTIFDKTWTIKLESKTLKTPTQQLVQSALHWGVFDRAPEPWYQGRDLIALGFQPGPLFGEALNECFEMQLDEQFPNSSEALVWLKKKMSP